MDIQNQKESVCDALWFLKSCERFAQKTLFVLESAGCEPRALSGEQLLRKVEATARALLTHVDPQQQVLLFLPHGLEYLQGLLGCLRANVVAVPVALVEFSQVQANIESLTSIVGAAKIDLLLTNTAGVEALRNLPQLSSVRVMNIDAEATNVAALTDAPLASPTDMAVMLFTSGSTSRPKGIGLSHAQLLAQVYAGASQWRIDTSSCLVSWLPHYHNFGLHFGFLVPLLCGSTSVLFSPRMFVQRPQRWLTTIAQHRATHTAAPNFAFDLLAKHADRSELGSDSLSSLCMIISGGEPIRYPTYRRFADEFHKHGLKRTLFCPHYGLSEVGSIVTREPRTLRFLSLDLANLQMGRVRPARRGAQSIDIIDCGKPIDGTRILIVDPQTLQPSEPDAVGEIWVASPGVAAGYWQQEALTREAFGVTAANQTAETYLRTGDLGFLRQGRLYISGRSKEVIIARGKNHYPVDIESTLQRRLTQLSASPVVFSCEVDGAERAILLQAVDTSYDGDYATLARAIISTVSEVHGLELFDVCLVRPEEIPKTGSGKIQRGACKEAYLRNSLRTFYRSREVLTADESRSSLPPRNSMRRNEILGKLHRDVLAPELGLDVVMDGRNLSELGLDSIQCVRIAKRIEEVFDIQFAPTLLFKYRSVNQLVEHIADCSDRTGDGNASRPTARNIAAPAGQVDDVAIIGMAGSFPGADNLQVFWSNLLAGKDCIASVSSERAEILRAANSDAEELVSFPQWGGFVSDVDAFDATFFGIAPLEAESMDPQQRKVLELVWTTIESAGYNPRTMAKRDVAFFAAAHNCDYAEVLGRIPHLAKTYGAYLDSGLHMSLIANRVSRWFDFRGRSELVNTACSSSLVAVCHAVQALIQNDCELALVAGINLILSPRIYLASHQAGMLALDGRCKTFDQAANGFVRAEGFGAVFLKPLSQALKNKDSIYGVIKSAVINHDGHSNSLRAPNLDAQKQLIEKAYVKSGVPVDTITYLEAHGTGTGLGDPIEVQALQEAFAALNPKLPTSYCGLGTVKTHIGHCESAAGIAGLLKTLLAMQHGELPGNLHFNELNPHIRLADGPFYVVQSNRPWERLHDAQGNQLPRRAGISSFGFGGTNAHVVVEEYCGPCKIEVQPVAMPSDLPALVVLSARNEEQLKAQATQLVAHLQSQQGALSDLWSVAYTLQVGREAMQQRLAFTATSIEAVCEKLSAYLAGDEVDEWYRGDTKKNKEVLSIVNADDVMQQALTAWIGLRQFGKLLELWTKGLSFDWARLYREGSNYAAAPVKRIFLPTYPFARERYWIQRANETAVTERTALHPLLQQNTSDLDGQRFSSVFTGREFFLADHVVLGNRILPGVCYLEMARAAVERSIGCSDVARASVMLHDVVWLRPVSVDDRTEVLIRLFSEEGGQIAFEVYTCRSGESGEVQEVVHAEGRAAYSPIVSPSVNRLDLQSLRAKCDHSIDIARCYSAFEAMGIVYGPAHRGLASVECGTDRERRFVLSQIRLPDSVSETSEQYVLHPSVLDSALQATIGLSLTATDHSAEKAAPMIRPSMPFALQRLEILDRSPDIAWVYVCETERVASAAGTAQRLDIDICDAVGRVCVRLQGFTTRVLESQVSTTRQHISTFVDHPALVERMDMFPTGAVLAAVQWEVAVPSITVTWPTASSVVVLAGGTNGQRRAWQEHYPQACILTPENDDTVESISQALSEFGRIDHLVWLSPPDSPADEIDATAYEGFIRDQHSGVIGLFRLVKALLALDYGALTLGLSVVTWQTQAVRRESHNPTHASVHGLVGSLAKEYAHWQIRLVDLPIMSAQVMTQELLDEVLHLSPDPNGNAFAYRRGEWHQQRLLPVEQFTPQAASIREGGVYVVVGGAGGIGEVFSEYLIQKFQARLIWIGRRELTLEIQAKIDRLSTLGPAPVYLCADATDRAALEQAYRQIKAQYDRISGVVHAAIALLDKSLAQMDEARFKASLSAKVDVSVRMAQVFAHEQLDFVLFFSSLQSFSKAAGQSNYAAGCAFKDAFALYLSHLWPCRVRVMNWGYWGSVGVVASAAYRERMASQGIGSIEPAEGMAALEQLLGGSFEQVAFMKATQSRALADLNALNERISIVQSESISVAQHLSSPTSRELALDEMPTGVVLIERLPRLLEKLLYVQLQSLGLFADPARTITEWRHRIELPDLFLRWLVESIQVLADQGYLSVEDDRCAPSSNAPSDAAVIWNDWEACTSEWLKDCSLAAQVTLVDLTMRALPEILTGRRRATDILFPDSSMELVEGIYKHNVIADYFNDVMGDKLAEFVAARRTQDATSRIRILEIGAGTGGTSEAMFKRLKPHEETIGEYCYTDLSKAFLLHAENTYGPATPYLTYSVFNVEQPPGAQSIAIGVYDVVVATNVLHATKSIRHTLRNAKAALKRGGLLMLNEINGHSLFTHLTFGLLEGWWLYKDPTLRISGTPALEPDSWRQALELEGFRNVFFPASTAHRFGQQVILAESDGVIRQLRLCDDERADKRKQKCDQEQNVAATPQVTARSSSLPAIRTADDASLSVASSGEISNRPTIGEQVRREIRAMIGAALKIDGARIQEDNGFAEYGVDSIVAVSLIKKINERFKIGLPTTSVFDYHTVELLAAHIAKEHGGGLEATFGTKAVNSGADQPVFEPERESRDRLPEPPVLQVRPARTRERKRTQGAPANRSLQPRLVPGHPTYFRVVINGPGCIDDLYIEEATAPAIMEDEVQIAVHACSLNFGDLLCIKGLYPTIPPYPFTPGFEVSGTVVAVGAAVATVKPGDAVVAIMSESLGGQATLATCSERQVFQKAPSLSFEEACALPVVAITMLDAFRKAQVRKGESVLIQTATGGTGLIAVQLAKHFGAAIYATAGSERKLDHLRSLGVANRINYLTTDFESEIRRLTDGRGVDVVINTLSGDAIQKGLNCLAEGGRYIEIAMTALKSARNINLSVLSDNQSFYSVDLRKLGLNRPDTLAEYHRELMELVERGVISPTIGETLPFDRIGDAYRRIENRDNIGKIVVAIPESIRFRAAVASLQGAISSSTATLPAQREPIAIIGMSGRFGKADSVNELWNYLRDGIEITEEVTRWNLSDHLGTFVVPGEGICSKGGLLRDVDRFDPLFFNIAGTEATYTDPQQRLFLEEAWKALEDAGYVGAAIEAQRCGVYVGCARGDYAELFDGKAPAQAFWGNSGAIIPARISYYLNLRGPAIAVDTACSSSLVAMHLACQGLWNKETTLALAGGVHVQCTPSFYKMSTRAGMLSPSGRCHAFDDRADGFVPGEGVAVVILKRLSEALADGDHIYGVIRASCINQDGATNGITAPSALSQERLERDVYETFGIHPDDIQMVEAHGTGTKLGDPIEWRALTNAFRKDTNRKHFCAIGSIKTNVGHTTAAAGVAGIMKILLAMRAKQIPPSLHFQHGNSHIDFEDSPFYVNTQLRPWEVPVGKKRRAAVSSFGFSGTNAHMVIEEAPATDRTHLKRPAYLIVLSARTAAQLKEQAERLVAHCRSTLLDCGNISYTLLLGRKHQSHRLACVVRTTEELIFALGAWLENGKAPRVYDSQMHGAPIDEVGAGEGAVRDQASLKRYGEQCIGDCRSNVSDAEYLDRLSSTADLYVQECELNFAPLFAGDRYSRVSLPGYPFGRERYWVGAASKETADASIPSAGFRAAVLHSLLQRNTSQLDEQRFSSTFSGEEPYLSDHRIGGAKVLPGVCYLEMARAAVERSVETQYGRSVVLKNVVWMQPMVVTGPCELHIGLFAQDGEEIAFQIYAGARDSAGRSTGSHEAGNAQRKTLHAQGVAVVRAVSSGELKDRIDVAALQAAGSRSIEIEACYTAFAFGGIEYGPAHRGLEAVSVGTDAIGGRFALARVRLPACVVDTQDQFVLHPSLLDSALQATIGFAIDESYEDMKLRVVAAGPSLPFALERLEIVDRVPSVALVCVRPVAVYPTAASPKSGSIQKFDIDIGDESGRICVRMQGFTARVLDNRREERAATRPSESLLFATDWIAKSASKSAEDGAEPRVDRWVLVDAVCNIDIDTATARSSGVNWAMLSRAPADTIDAEWVELYAEQVLAQAQSILRGKPRQAVLVQIVIVADGARGLLLGALSAMLKTASLENPKFVGQLIGVPSVIGVDRLLQIIDDNSHGAASRDEYIRYLGEVRTVACFRELNVVSDARRQSSPPWKDGGVYLITGGAGGLGRIFAQEIVRSVKNPRMILTGRTGLTAETTTDIDTMIRSGNGARIEYLVLDVTDAVAVVDAVTDILARHGSLSGLLHGAGVINDNIIANKSREEFRTTLAPKIRGITNLDLATQSVELDFIFLFSSLAGAFGNVGQCDYATANAYMDLFASYRNELVQHGRRRGPTLSINWPLWAAGGMQVTEATSVRMRRQGLVAMSTVDGLAALDQAWQSGESQVLIMHGDASLITQRMLHPDVGQTIEDVRDPNSELLLNASVPVFPAPAIGDADLAAVLSKLQGALVLAISKQLNVKVEEIDIAAELSEFGFDSISLTEFGNHLNRTYALDLSPTIFFEFPTVHGFSGYLVEAFRTQMLAHFAPPMTTRTLQPALKVAKPGSELAEKRANQGDWLHGRRTNVNRALNGSEPQLKQIRSDERFPEPIAIIGMSGCFPGAPDLDAFWKNLESGKDSIVEIPPARWSWRATFGDPKREPNKTNIKWGGFIDGVDEFDPLFFNISPKEAVLIDPQQRLLLTYAWKVIEDAGYSPQSLSGSRTGIFVGTGNSGGYGDLIAQADVATEGYSATGIVSSVGPNRMSYLLNLHGPSEPIETACSSSLVAVHRAVRAIRTGDCDMALVGGVNTMVTPWAHISFSKAGMLSADGRCKTFSKDANGYVRGEGVGMLFLKRLAAAKLDGDHIYGVIKATAENHGGRANSLTAPNPKAQADLIAAAYREAEIDPRSVTYIETHGTGTPLGDPIEINGLKSAFAELYADTGDRSTEVKQAHCGIGSVKTNIGHLELAAGVAGMVKVLLQFQHRTLAKSLHCDEVNPYIQLHESPFYIVDETRPWLAIRDQSGRDLPRRAGVSSFGFGGVNAHVVLEEHVESPRSRHPSADISPDRQALVVLSAKGEERLKEQAGKLLAHIKARDYADADLADIAYTLQVGREAMEYRLAFAVFSIDDMVAKLTGYVDGQGSLATFAAPNAPADSLLSYFSIDSGAKELLQTWFQKRDLEKLANLWTRGLDLDWRFLHVETTPRRLSLPGYSFSRERYWIPHRDSAYQQVSGRRAERFLHPLLHENTSTFAQARFVSRFTGDEFFLTDHQVRKQRILPGAAHLEMVRAAVAYSRELGERPVTLHNVVWRHPVVVDSDVVAVNVTLEPHGIDEMKYEVHRELVADGEKEIFSSGKATWTSSTAPKYIDVAAVRAECNRAVLTAQACYAMFAAFGIDYGTAHRALDTIYRSENKALAKICLPESLSATLSSYVLHPAMVDAALQSCIGVLADSTGSLNALALPFALNELHVFAPCTTTMWAYVSRVSIEHADSDKQILDIDLCNESGRVCVELRGLSLRAAIDTESKFGTEQDEQSRMSLAQLEWQDSERISETTSDYEYAVRTVIFCGVDAGVQGELEAHLAGVHCLQLHDSHANAALRFQYFAEHVLAEIQRLFQQPAPSLLLQLVYSTEDEGELAAGLLALLSTAQQENSRFAGQMIGLDSVADTATIAGHILSDDATSDPHIRYSDGRRRMPIWRPAPDTTADKLPWKPDGIYLVTGGAGGLGFIFAEEIRRTCPASRVVLIGRSALTDGQKVRLDELKFSDGSAEYRQADVTDSQAVIGLIRDVTSDYGRLDGILHGAGLLRDGFIQQKNNADLLDVLAPKVLGIVNLDEASKLHDLDFFVAFSSLAGATGNAGQADYAAANAFMDAYATYRDRLVAQGRRQGKSLSINWPLWKQGGIQVDAVIEARIRAHGGVIATAAGMQAFRKAMSLASPQILVTTASLAEINSASRRIATKPQRDVDNRPAGEANRARLTSFVTDTLTEVLGIPQEKLSVVTPFEKYGIDSVLQMTLIQRMERRLGDLPKTLLFEHSNIGELVNFLALNYEQAFRLPSPLPSNEAPELMAIEPLPEPISSIDTTIRSASEDSVRSQNQDIAIIGISGRFPQSETLDELWHNLISARNCVSRVPADRWRTSLATNIDGDRNRSPENHFGGFLSGVDRFDHSLFEIPESEVLNLSPELRIFLEIAWETFAAAGYGKSRLQALQSRSNLGIGVFIGSMYNQYSWTNPSITDAVLGSNETEWQLANRVSHFFDLSGPSLAINTACSSSLTAIHLACESLRQGGCPMAIAGGINLSLDPSKYDKLQQAQFLDSGSASKSFGMGGGYIPGEGAGAVLLKPLAQAIADNDRIDAVIKGSFINHSGGRQKYSVPDPKRQAELITQSIRLAKIDASSITYVESAATGSQLGDPIELIALNNAFSKLTAKKQFCAIGSVKSNLGHLEAASGISQLSKVLLQLRHRTLVPSINADPLNPNIKLDSGAFYLQRETAPWKTLTDANSGITLPRRSMINSFGAGGAYANLIVEEYVVVPSITSDRQESNYDDCLCLFSAMTSKSLLRYLENFRKFLREQPQLDIAAVASSLRKVNADLRYRVAVTARSRADLLEKLDSLLDPAATAVSAGVFRSMGDGKPAESLLPVSASAGVKSIEQVARNWTDGQEDALHDHRQSFDVPCVALPRYSFEHEIAFNFSSAASVMRLERPANAKEFYRTIFERIANGELSDETAWELITNSTAE